MKKTRLPELLAFLLMAPAVVNCQTKGSFAYKTAVGPVPETKFYSVQLSPRLLASCKTYDLSDIRITDSAGGTIPYILQSYRRVNLSNTFIPYPILSNTRKDSTTELIIENRAAGAVSSLMLIIKNASAYRKAVLSGSDDKTNWFVIDENVEVQQSGSSTGDSFVQPLLFPESNYHYLKLTINDRGLLPLNILQAGEYKNAAPQEKFVPLPLSGFTQKDSTDRYSYLIIPFSYPFLVDRLQIKVKKPSFYKRSYEIYKNDPPGYTLVEQAELSPASNTVRLSARTTGLMIKIFNADNLPLVIDSVIAFQVSQQLVAQMEKDKKYYILTGDSAASKPAYDLQYFRDSIPSSLNEITTGATEKTNAVRESPQADSSHSKMVLWTVIAVVLLLLLFITVNMLKEVNKKKQQE